MASSSLLHGDADEATKPGYAIDDDDEQVESNDDNDDNDDLQNGNSKFDSRRADDQEMDQDEENDQGVDMDHGEIGDSSGVDMLAGHLPVFPYPLPPHGAFPMMPGQMIHPFFLTPPHFNPYSPSQGSGEHYPPAISQNPYPLPPVPPHLMMDPSMEVHPGMTLDVHMNEASMDGQETSPRRPRRKHTNEIISFPSVPIEQMYRELPPPPPEADPLGPNYVDTGHGMWPKWECTHCKAKFPRKNAVIAHIKTHVGKRRHVCSHPGCNQAFVREHDCKRHEATHSNLRSHVCNCGRPFARPDALRRHQDRGHCSLTPKLGGKARSASAGSALPSGSGDTSWPLPGEGVPYNVEDHAELMSLTRQLAETQAAAQSDGHLGVPSLPSPKLGQSLDELDPHEEDMDSTTRSKSRKKTGKRKGAPRNKRSVKSGDTVHDGDDDDLGETSNISTSLRTIGSSLHNATGFNPDPTLGSYGTPPPLSGAHPPHFVPFPHTLLPQDGSTVADSGVRPNNGISHPPFIPAAGAHSPSSLLPSNAPYTYHTTLDIPSGSLGLASSLNTATGTGDSSGSVEARGVFARDSPNSGTTPPALVGASTSGRAPGVSLVQLAVSAATLAQQEKARLKTRAEADALENMGTGARLIPLENSQQSIDPDLQRISGSELEEGRGVGESSDMVGGASAQFSLNPVEAEMATSSKTRSIKIVRSAPKKSTRTRSKAGTMA